MSGHDALWELPIVEELGTEFRALVAKETGETSPRSQPTARARLRTREPSRRRGHGPRVARRVSVMLALLCLVGGVALAARFGAGDGGAPPDTEPVALGSVPGLHWRVSAYRHSGKLCFSLTGGGLPSASCAPPPEAGRLRSLSALIGDRRLVFGLTDERVAKVSVAVGDRRSSALTRAPAERGTAARAGLPTGVRWFAVIFPARPGQSLALAPARIAGLGRSGRQLGPLRLDCSLGISTASCRRSIEARARHIAR